MNEEKQLADAQSSAETQPKAETRKRSSQLKKAASPAHTDSGDVPVDGTIFDQLLYIQQHLNVGKTETNPQEGYPYRSEEAILAAVTPLLGKVRCILYFRDSVEKVDNGYIYLKTVCTLLNSNGEVFEIPGYAREDIIIPGKSQAQITGACSTYAHKYALKSLFGLSGEKVAAEADPDSEGSIAPQVKPVAGTEEPAREDSAAAAKEPEKPAVKTPEPSRKVSEATLGRPVLTPSSPSWNKVIMKVVTQKGTHTRKEYADWLRGSFSINDADLDTLLRQAGKAA